MKIEELSAGSEMNLLVAQARGQTDFAHVGFFWAEGTTEDGQDGSDGLCCPRCGKGEDQKDEPCVKDYSGDNAAALGLLEQERRRGRSWNIYIGTPYVVSNYDDDCRPLAGWGWGERQTVGMGNTLAVAICRAVYKAYAGANQ